MRYVIIIINAHFRTHAYTSPQEHGLVEREGGGVILKCHPKYEAAGYAEFEATFEATEYLLDPALDSIPTYLLYGEVADIM